MPCPCRAAFIHKCNAAPLSFSDSAVFFVKVCVVTGNIRTANPIYASDKLRGTLRGNRKKLNAGRSPTCRLWTDDAISHMPCHAMSRTRCAAALISRFQKGMIAAWARHDRGMGAVWARHGRGMACVNQTRPYCVNQMGKTI
jgi:hypothetical protein